ncbi:MAG: ATP-binding protein [Eubacteriales bacterium]
MGRSILMKLVMIMILLILSLVIVVGAFLVNSVSGFYLTDFYSQMETVFADRNLLMDLSSKTEQEENGAEMIAQVLNAYSGTLGIDGRNRKFYVLDGESGTVLVGSEENEVIHYSPNLLLALQEKIIGDKSNMIVSYMDLAIPITRGEESFVIYIIDGKETVSQLINQMVELIFEALLVALVISILLSFLLSETMVTPLRELTKGASKLAEGDFSHVLQVSSRDEIGNLTEAFNNMAKQLEDTLEQVEQERDKLDTLFLHMNDGVLAFSWKGWLIHSNPSAGEMLCRTLDEDISSYEGLMGEIAPFATVLEAEDCVTGELEVHGRVLEVILAPLEKARQGQQPQSPNQGGVLAVLRDVTAQKENEQLQREFVANVSHELRTPITNIKSYAETLKEAEGDIPPEMEQKFLGVIVGESDRMTHIVQDLLTLSRFDSSHADLKFSSFPFGEAVQELYDAVFMEASRRGHSLILKASADLPDIIADRPRVLQVMMNITSNALKYTPDGGEILLTAGKRGDMVFLSVEDNGVGIPEEDRPRIFQRFFRVDKARSRKAGGVGLGLAIAQEIVQGHGGTLTLDSKEGKGSKFTMALAINGVKQDD